MLLYVTWMFVLSAPSFADTTRIRFSIVSQSLDAALLEFAEQADMDIVGLSSKLSKLTSQSLDGLMSRTEALDILLAGTDLKYHIFRQRAVVINEPSHIVPQPLVTQTQPFNSQNALRVLEEITVSATRRNTNLQKTPIAITAIDMPALRHHQVKDLRDITSIVPGLEMIDTGPQAAILAQLRGVGATNITEIADGPVALHVDGVYSPRSQSTASLLFDVDRVEVLRGPQGSLFGRNSTSGSINIYNNQPNLDAPSSNVFFSYGDYNQKEFRGTFNIPITKNLSLRVAGAGHKHDAYTKTIDNYAGLGPQYPATENSLRDFDQGLNLGQKGLESANRLSWRVSSLWQPTDKFSALLSVERYHDRSTGIAELDPTLVNKGIRAVVLDSDPYLNLTNDSFRSRFEYYLAGDYKLTYIAGLSEMNRQQLYDADNGRDGSFEQQRTHSSTFKFYSHEIQLLNSDDERLRWVSGIFFSQEKNDIVFAIDQQNAGGGRSPIGASSWISNDTGAAVSYAVQPNRQVRSLGVFAQATYDFTESSRLTSGLRYTRDSKSDQGGRTINCRVTSILGSYVEPGSIGPGAPNSSQIYADKNAAAAIAAGLPFDNGTNVGIGNEPCWVRQVNDFAIQWENTSGLLRFDIDLSNDVLLYLSVSNGFKSGHIQDAGNTAEPETVINYEIGTKSQWFDNAVRMNTALYFADYNDLQYSNLDRLDTNNDGVADTGGSTVVRNASEATVKGMELELEWAITHRDHLQVTGSIMKAHFNEFQIPDTLFGDVFNPSVDELTNRSTALVDLSGNAPPRTPDWKFTIVYEHDFTIGSLTLTPRILATVSDRYFLDIYNRKNLAAGVFPGVPNGGKNLGVQSAYQTYDVSFRLHPTTKQWLAEVYINNITDENIKVSSGNFVTENGFTATYRAPRTYGVTFSYFFNES